MSASPNDLLEIQQYYCIVGNPVPNNYMKFSINSLNEKSMQLLLLTKTSISRKKY